MSQKEEPKVESAFALSETHTGQSARGAWARPQLPSRRVNATLAQRAMGGMGPPPDGRGRAHPLRSAQRRLQGRVCFRLPRRRAVWPWFCRLVMINGADINPDRSRVELALGRGSERARHGCALTTGS